MNTLIAAVIAVIGSLAVLFLTQRHQRRDRSRKAAEAVHEKLREQYESMAEILRNAPPAG